MRTSSQAPRLLLRAGCLTLLVVGVGLLAAWAQEPENGVEAPRPPKLADQGGTVPLTFQGPTAVSDGSVGAAEANPCLGSSDGSFAGMCCGA
jgi:hypothetical protein